MAKSFYDKFMEAREKKNLAIHNQLNQGIPVENMNITGMSNALDGLYAMIMDYKQSPEYQEKLALAEERKAIKKGLREGGQPVLDENGDPVIGDDGKPVLTQPMSRKEARKKYKEDADKYAEEIGAEGNRYRKRDEYLRKVKADREAEQDVKDADEKSKHDDDKKDDNSPNTFRSPLTFGRADATLIAGARRMAQAGRSRNVFAGLDQMVDTMMLMKKHQREATRKELDNIVLEDIDNGFTAFANGPEACQGYLSEAKRELASLKAKALRLSPDSPEFHEVKSKMTSIENRWKTLNTEMAKLQTEKGQWADMHGAGVKNDPNSESDGRFRYSNGTLIEGNKSYDYLNQIMNKTANMIINPETGAIEWEVSFMQEVDDGQGGVTQIPQTEMVQLDKLKENIFERDDAGLEAYTKYRSEVENNQKNNLEFNQGKAESIANQLFGSDLSEPNKRNMVSWMYDDLDGDGKTFLDDWGSMLEGSGVNLDQFASTADWSKPYMIPEDQGDGNIVMVESGQTVGQFLRDELKAYYVERLRGFHNNLVQANGKSVRSKMGTGEPINADGEDFPNWWEGADEENMKQTTLMRNDQYMEQQKNKDIKEVYANIDQVEADGSGKIYVPGGKGAYYEKQGDRYVLIHSNGIPDGKTGKDDDPTYYSVQDVKNRIKYGD